MENKIYFIEQENNNLIKIGVAKNIKSRFSGLQTGSPQKLILRGYIIGGYEKEKELHNLFYKYNFGGEWFRLVDEITMYINENCLFDLNDSVGGRNNRGKDIKTQRYDGGNFNIVYTNKLEELNKMKLNNNEKLVFYVLRDYIQYPTNSVMINNKIPTIKEVEPIIGLTERSIIDVLKSLEEKNLIKRVQSGHKKAIYFNPEYYASGKDLDIEVLKIFNLLECDENKVESYIE